MNLIYTRQYCSHINSETDASRSIRIDMAVKNATIFM